MALPPGLQTIFGPRSREFNKIDVSKVQLISVQPGLDIQALTSRNIDAAATLYQSSAPYLWADKVEFETIFFAANGLDIYSLTFVTQPANLTKSSKQIAAFVEGVMEGLRFSYLNPDKTLDDFVAAVPKSGKTDRDRLITKHSLFINTATGLSEEVRKNGLGWHDPIKVDYTLKTVNTFLKLPNVPAVSSIYTNDFLGNVRLTEEGNGDVRGSWPRVI